MTSETPASGEFGDNFEKRLDQFNNFYDSKPGLKIQVNDDGSLEGQLRIYWGIIHPILFKEKDDDEPALTPLNRHSYSPMASADSEFVLSFDVSALTRNNGTPETPSEGDGKNRFGTVKLRNNKRRKKTRKRQSIINGHIYSTETSLFKPVDGTVTGVTVTSQQTTQQVIKALLDKFKVENHPIEFCLCVSKSNGELYALPDSESPLMERVRLGPLEDDAKICLMEKYRLIDINEEVAQFVNLPEAVLFGFLDKYMKDEEIERQLIRERYKIYREKLEERLETLV